MSINMCKLRHKVCNDQIYPLKYKFQAFQKFFQIKILLSILGFQKHIAEIRL